MKCNEERWNMEQSSCRPFLLSRYRSAPLRCHCLDDETKVYNALTRVRLPSFSPASSYYLMSLFHSAGNCCHVWCNCHCLRCSYDINHLFLTPAVHHCVPWVCGVVSHTTASLSRDKTNVFITGCSGKTIYYLDNMTSRFGWCCDERRQACWATASYLSSLCWCFICRQLCPAGKEKERV